MPWQVPLTPVAFPVNEIVFDVPVVPKAAPKTMPGAPFPFAVMEFVEVIFPVVVKALATFSPIPPLVPLNVPLRDVKVTVPPAVNAPVMLMP